MAFLGMGTLVVIVFTLFALIIGDWSILLKGSGTIGLVSFLISALLTGTFVSGDQMRANWSSESSDERDIREGQATKLILFALPNLAGAIVYLVLIKDSI